MRLRTSLDSMFSGSPSSGHQPSTPSENTLRCASHKQPAWPSSNRSMRHGSCTDLDMYIDLDWHSIGNLTTGLFQDPMYDTSQQETYTFWRTAARHFAGHNTIAFFELFNEPTTYRDQLGPVNWMEWKRMQEDLVAIIRAYNPQVIPLVAGFDWAYDLTPIRVAPINAEGIGYERNHLRIVSPN